MFCVPAAHRECARDLSLYRASILFQICFLSVKQIPRLRLGLRFKWQARETPYRRAKRFGRTDAIATSAYERDLAVCTRGTAQARCVGNSSP
jgi:hypothetical protein